MRQILNPWTILGALLSGLLLAAAAFAILANTRPPSLAVVDPTAEIRFIDAPTITPIIVTPPSTSPAPTLEIPPSPLPGLIASGAIVQITGTGGEGLNLRATPGLESKVQYLGFESEVFMVVEGPEEKDGLMWWRIVGFSDETRSGWAAANFLEIVQTP